MISVKQKGDYSKFKKYLNDLQDEKRYKSLQKYAEIALTELKNNTPLDTGRTADSWSYTIVENNRRFEIQFFNSNVNKYVNIAIILQYGHGTRNGGWVEGRDYINPSIQPAFEKLANEAWMEVAKL